ncbi:hypothetical protein EYF80_056533 [Liparis tanakae]|uniref:Uncharacterized protein n=1 Tax=Liparis tanakae TaxID=230148 RepID=A0A4Z2EWI3_9TELE|nr:hypothetical protein EYF80_056533 [Liparis tanakae]
MVKLLFYKLMFLRRRGAVERSRLQNQNPSRPGGEAPASRLRHLAASNVSSRVALNAARQKLPWIHNGNARRLPGRHAAI